MTLELHNVTVSYDRHPAIHHVNGVFAVASKTAIVGPNGGGKSTLLRAIAGLLPVEQGAIKGNIEKGRLAFLPQQNEINRDFPITVNGFLAMAFVARKGLFQSLNKTDAAKIQAALDDVGLHACGKRSLRALSAGQFQRILFARVALQDAKIILLDEPFTAVDEKSQPVLLAQINKWHAEGRTIICVLHDVHLIRHHFPQSLLIARDVIGWGATADVLTAENTLRLQGFNEAWRDHAEICTP